MQERKIVKIIPGLHQVSMEDAAEEGPGTLMKPIQNFDELALKLKSAISVGGSVRMEFIFQEESNIKKQGKPKKIKSE